MLKVSYVELYLIQDHLLNNDNDHGYLGPVLNHQKQLYFFRIERLDVRDIRHHLSAEFISSV